MRVQDQTEPQVEPALMWDPRTTSERRNGLCIRRNFGAAQEQACETCRMLRGRGHHGSQHANATEFFRSELRNLLKWMLAATDSVEVALESAGIMLLGFRVRLLGLRSAHFRARHLHRHLLRTLVIAVRTCCKVPHGRRAAPLEAPIHHLPSCFSGGLPHPYQGQSRRTSSRLTMPAPPSSEEGRAPLPSSLAACWTPARAPSPGCASSSVRKDSSPVAIAGCRSSCP